MVAYNGSRYHGWQRQADGIDTVQQRIEEAARDVLGHPVILFGAGRTDAGVHAEGQVANLYTPNFQIPGPNLRRAVNSRLPADICIRSIQPVPEEFHASRSAVGKTYRYRVYVAPTRPVELAGMVYHFWRPLDAERMAAAARKLVGKHDFAGLAARGDQRETTVRTIFRCDVAEAGCEIHIAVQGDGFLYKMVRGIAGTLIEIGRGHWGPERIDELLAAADRRLAGPTAPAEGLAMMCVHYRLEDLGRAVL